MFSTSSLSEELGFRNHEKLKLRLNQNNAWKKVAEKLRLRINRESGKSPGAQLLTELEMRLCSVERLRRILQELDLREALSLLMPHSPVIILKQPSEDEDMHVALGGQLKLEVVASGNPIPQYVWFHDNIELEDQTKSVLVKKGFTEDDEGMYSCILVQEYSDDEDGVVTEVATRPVEVKLYPEDITIVEQPHDFCCYLGDDIILYFGCETRPRPQYQWYYGNTSLTGQDSEVLTISNASSENAGEYKCYVTNGYAEVWSNPAIVTVSTSENPHSAVSEKIALLIGNEYYHNMSRLRHSQNDVATLSEILTNLGFKVLALCDLTSSEMRSAIKKVCEIIPKDAFVVFYFAGHGFKLHVNCMLPVDAPERFVFDDVVLVNEVLRTMLNTEPKLLLVFFDMCLISPEKEENPDIFKAQVPIIQYKSNRNLVQVYATACYQSAYERKNETTGLYMKHLKKFLHESQPITQVLHNTNHSFAEEEGKGKSAKQIPTYKNCLAHSYCLTSPARSDDKATQAFILWNSVNNDKKIFFKEAQTECTVSFQKFRNCFHNVLEMRVKNLEGWTPRIEIFGKEIEMRPLSDGNTYFTSIHNLQKLKMELTLTISLYHDRTLIDNCLLELKKPLIVPAQLWYETPLFDSVNDEQPDDQRT